MPYMHLYKLSTAWMVLLQTEKDLLLRTDLLSLRRAAQSSGQRLLEESACAGHHLPSFAVMPVRYRQPSAGCPQ